MSAFRRRTLPVVLLVQPQDDSRDMYAEFLHHHSFEPVCPTDAADALTRAPMADVIVTGLQLPGGIDGFEFIRRLRGSEQTKAKPIIVLTSWAWQTERLLAEDAGCDVFLTKPCLPDKLLSHVRRVLASAKSREVRGKAARREPAAQRPDHARRGRKSTE